MVNILSVNVSTWLVCSDSASHLLLCASVCLPTRSKMKFDNILSEVNGFGKFQIRLFLIQMFSRMTLPCHFLLNNFMAAVPAHHCDISALQDRGVLGNLTFHQKLVASIPTKQDGTLSLCRMFTKPRYQNWTDSSSSEEVSSVPCQKGWLYDNSTFKSTLVTEVTQNFILTLPYTTHFHFCQQIRYLLTTC